MKFRHNVAKTWAPTGQMGNSFFCNTVITGIEPPEIQPPRNTTPPTKKSRKNTTTCLIPLYSIMPIYRHVYTLYTGTNTTKGQTTK